MWNKREEEQLNAGRPAGAVQPPPSVEPRHEVSVNPGSGAAIGPSITIVGELTGEEDLTILGKVEGTIQLPKHCVTIGRTAKVTADIRAKAVSVEGEVRGNLQASEQILIRKTATMLGNLAAPRVGLEDGCRFKGSVDMESSATPAPRAAAPHEAPARPPESGPKPVTVTPLKQEPAAAARP
ncbi:MAG TPA: polymer-forming cytoskeletal protein [Vicinamibacteria bacterium]|nr:polymer-forming cytoskeletal protein [Vicinamibacteria bacterium]